MLSIWIGEAECRENARRKKSKKKSKCCLGGGEGESVGKMRALRLIEY
jgi:hypothetical protein